MTTEKKKTATKKKAVKFYNPPNVLRQKCGYGGIDPKILERAEEFIARNDVDFVSIAAKILDRLDKAVVTARQNGNLTREEISRVIGPIMELKANGAMFKFSLLSEVGDIALNFLETMEKPNDDALELIDVSRKTLRAIITSDLKGSGGLAGSALLKELNEACQRYHKKHGSGDK